MAILQQLTASTLAEEGENGPGDTAMTYKSDS
jgi:hypothetical protein